MTLCFHRVPESKRAAESYKMEKDLRAVEVERNSVRMTQLVIRRYYMANWPNLSQSFLEVVVQACILDATIRNSRTEGEWLPRRCLPYRVAMSDGDQRTLSTINVHRLHANNAAKL